MNMRPTMPIIAALALALAPAAAAQAPAPAAEPAQVIGKVSGGAQAELNRSIATLNELRAQISAEKLPIAQQLTQLEESVVEQRKEEAKVQRLVDAGALEIATLKAEMKSRQDELGYVSSLLDEYVRNFETKIGVGEVQVLAAPIEDTKQALENKALSPEERFGKQTGFVDRTIKRLVDAVGGTRFAGVGVDAMGTVLNGQFAMIGPVTLFRSDSGVAGVAVPQVGSANPLVRPLEGEMAGKVAPLVETGSGTIPLDPSRGGALKALVQKFNLVHVFIQGGPIMWPLLFASVCALAVVLERVIFLMIEASRRSSKQLGQFMAAVGHGDLDGAIALSKKSKDAVVTTLGYALEHRDQSLGHALNYAENRTMKRYKRGIAVLDTVITLAPLLGLLGTVTGMMASFATIGGDLSSPGAITGGISEALIATAFGLVIAITCLLPFNYLNNRIEVLENEMVGAGEQLKLMVEGRAGPVAQAAVAAARTAAEPRVPVSAGGH